jgi:hypothetical protein
MVLALVCACGNAPPEHGGGVEDMAQATTPMTGDMAMAMNNGAVDMAKMMNVMDMAMMMGGGGIPDPGMTSNGPYFDNVNGKPNLTPQTATPLGPLTGPGVAIWVTGNTIAANTTNYFVFSAHDNGTLQPGINQAKGICGNPLVLSKIDVWKVVNHQQQTPPQAEWTPTAADPNCIVGSTALVAGDTYLVGFTAGGKAGGYSV